MQRAGGLGRLIPLQIGGCGFGLCADGGDGLVDLVGHARRDLTQCGQLARLHQFVPQGLTRRLGQLAFLDLAVQGQVGVAEILGPFGDAALQFDAGGLGCPLSGGGLLAAAQQHPADAEDQRQDQRRQGARVGGRRLNGAARRRQQVQGPAGRDRIGAAVHPVTLHTAEGRLDQAGTVGVGRHERQGCQGFVPQCLIGQRQLTTGQIQWFQGAEPPFRHAGDQDDAARVDDIGGFAGC